MSSSRRQINDYERSRMLRVQENQGKLQEFGVKNIVRSLTSLVDSQNLKKRKRKPSVTNEKDLEYIPDFDADNEGDYPEEVNESVKIGKKYIPPMCMSRYATLSKKKRVIAPNSPGLLRSEEGRHLADPNATKNNRVQLFDEGQLRNEKSISRKATRLNQPRETTTMADLILNKKGSQRKALANSNSITKIVSSGARRKLFLVDNEDDYISSQDMNEADENEDRDQFILQDDENEQDGPEDDLELEDDEIVQEQLTAQQSRKRSAISNMKKRGPTMMHGIHTRKFDEREVIICNEFGQPVGPVTKEKDTVGTFSRFLGTIARNDSYAPLTHSSWHKVPHKDKMWEYVSGKYIVPENAKNWVLQSIGACWRVYKCRIKSKYFYKYKDNKTRWRNRPECIPEKDFATLLRLWSNKEVMKRCSFARDIRVSQKNMHTAGPKSFARIREELKNEDPNKGSPTLSKIFERTRKRTEGNVYVDTYDDTAQKIEQMKNYRSRKEDISDQEDPYLVVMGKEYNGHRRLYGKTVTNKLIKKVRGGEKSNTVSSEPIDSLKGVVEVENSLHIDMSNELDEEQERNRFEQEEDYESKKAELEAIRDDIDNKRDKLIADAVQMILQKLPAGVVQEFLT